MASKVLLILCLVALFTPLWSLPLPMENDIMDESGSGEDESGESGSDDGSSEEGSVDGESGDDIDGEILKLASFNH